MCVRGEVYVVPKGSSACVCVNVNTTTRTDLQYWSEEEGSVMNVSMFDAICRVCDMSEDEGAAFSPNRVRRCDWICNACRHKQRRADPVRHLTHKLQSSMRH